MLPTSCYLSSLQCALGSYAIKRWSLLPHCWNLDWPCDWLRSIKPGGSNLVPAKASESPVHFCSQSRNPASQQPQAGLLDDKTCGPATSYHRSNTQATFRSRAVQLTSCWSQTYEWALLRLQEIHTGAQPMLPTHRSVSYTSFRAPQTWICKLPETVSSYTSVYLHIFYKNT